MATNLGIPDTPLVVLPADIETWGEDAARRHVGQVLDKVALGLTQNRSVNQAGPLETVPRESGEFRNVNTVQELFREKQWTDGLPIIAPTEDLVQAMMATAKKPPQEIVASLAPQWGAATIEKLAVNAVMAGCRPEYFPVVVAAVEAMAEPAFNLQLHSTCTSSTTPLFIVNGPVRKALEMDSGFGVFGSTARPNATIGRALRLIRLNIGGQVAGHTDMSTFGFPGGGNNLCIAEDEGRHPWEPLHVQRGFRAEDSTVTVFGADGFQDVHHTRVVTPRGVLTIIAHSVAWMGSRAFHVDPRDVGYIVVILNPDHARKMADAGFSLRDVQLFLLDNARFPVEYVPEESLWRLERWGNRSRIVDGYVYMAAAPEQFVVLVSGGPGGGSSGQPALVIHGNPQDWKMVTKKIEYS